MFGTKLKVARIKAGILQREVAEYLNITVTDIRDLESGRKAPPASLYQIQDIEALLDTVEGVLWREAKQGFALLKDARIAFGSASSEYRVLRCSIWGLTEERLAWWKRKVYRRF